MSHTTPPRDSEEEFPAPPPPAPPFRLEAEALARHFLAAAGAWGAPQPSLIEWGPRLTPPAVPVRSGVTLCAPWVEAYERELEPVLKLTAHALPEKPTAEAHPNASLDMLQLLRDEWRHDVHRQHLSHRPDPWEPLITLRLLGVVVNSLSPERVELREILPMVEARSEARRDRPEGCICDFPNGQHRFSCLRQGQVVLPVERTGDGRFRVKGS